MTFDESLLLPRPTTVTRTDASFTVALGTRIAYSVVPDDPEDAEDLDHRMWFTASVLQRTIDDLLGFMPQFASAARATDDIALRIEPVEGDDARTAQGYRLTIGRDGVTVTGRSEAGLFYGVQTLIQIARVSGHIWPGMEIEDQPALAVRGLMLDVSRGRVPKTETLLDLARMLAHYKFNHLQLYTEHTFLFPRHPEIGAEADALTPEDVRALDAVCRQHHIELVPNLQTIGHHQVMLKLPRYADLAETDWTWSLAYAREETFELLDELFGDLLPCFTSSWFNVNADEPWDIGLGQSKAITERDGVGQVYLGFIRRLYDLTKKHGHRMMMWADVLPHHPDLIDQLPDDVLLLDWSYESVPHYKTLDALAASGRPFWVCPATSTWTTLFPRMENAVANIHDYVEQGIAAGASGMLLTEWGDGGHYQQPSLSWYLYLWGAETGWTGGTTSRDDFDLAFDRLFLGDGTGAVTAALRRLGETTQTEFSWLTTWNTAMALLEEPLAGTLSEIVPPETVAATREAAEALLPLLNRIPNRTVRQELGFTIAQLLFATEKIETTRAVRALLTELASQSIPTDTGRARFATLLTELRRQRETVPELARGFAHRWHATSRRSEIRTNLDRFAALRDAYDRALLWLEGQNAAYLRGEGVDAALSTYDRGGYAVLHEATRRWLMELVEIVGFSALPPDLQEWLGHDPATADAAT